MKWSDVQLKPLRINWCDLKLIINKKINHKEIRDELIKNTNSTCQYCGGNYSKFLQCVPSKKKNSENIIEYEICCRLCYIINHINFGFDKDIILVNSNIPQLTIIRQTVDYYLKNDKIPNPKIIDFNATLVPFSIMEFSNFLNNNLQFV